MNDTRHWVVLRYTVDPVGFECKAVCHSQADAEAHRQAYMESRAAEANERRAEMFRDGLNCGHKAEPFHFDMEYRVRMVR